MAKLYVTIQGDTWDAIAYKTLGSEYRLPLLLEANRQHRKITIFPGGIELTIPEVDTSKHTERPPWLGEDDEL
ncbi:tail protein X [Desulfitobacterium chlororespirans]|uniref:Phage Tail Protein X n=1 Tax=Desulfitobacterium chlororespirans DSM 11544 TaxID=1121395 RepID=A0A1M7U2N2_9FIRM|nr:tail protein X [Desulfitobacterium chlororespirans]SHN77215.1 Phage Tail Protein X [Desulfitobacterium chlororespirans DSM 11544]